MLKIEGLQEGNLAIQVIQITSQGVPRTGKLRGVHSLMARIPVPVAAARAASGAGDDNEASPSPHTSIMGTQQLRATTLELDCPRI